MEWFHALILGLIQGLTEFIPVSSSGHLVLAQQLMGLKGDYLFFDIALHAATLLAVGIVMFKEFASLFKPPFKKLGLLAIATVPAAVAAFIFYKAAGGFFNDATYLCFFFLLTAAALIAAEVISKRRAGENFGLTLKRVFGLVKRDADGADKTAGTTDAAGTGTGAAKVAEAGAGAGDTVTLKTALFMGAAQAAAVFPGLSRSGLTITGGLAGGARRKTVAEFSFLMSAPIILGGALLACTEPNAFADINWAYVLLGCAAAFASGLFAVKFMLAVIGKANYKWFALYLSALSVITFIYYFL